MRVDDVTLLSGLTGPGTGQRCVLDGHQPAYLVSRGGADLLATPRWTGEDPGPDTRFLTTVGPGAVVPSTTVLGEWQLVLVPAAGTRLLPLSASRLRDIGYGDVAATEPARLPVPAPRAVPLVAAALARGLDSALLALADALRDREPPAGSVMISPGQIVSLALGSAVTGDGGVGWLRVAGGHARRNGDAAAVFGSGEPALLAGSDWVVVDGPATVESARTADLLAAGHLAAALDAHAVLILRLLGDRH